MYLSSQSKFTLDFWLLTKDFLHPTINKTYFFIQLSVFCQYCRITKFNMHPNVSDWPPNHLMLEGRLLLDNPVLSFQLWLDGFCSNDRAHSYSPSETLMAELDPIIMVETAASETMVNTSEHLLLVLSLNNDISISPKPIIGGAPQISTCFCETHTQQCHIL